jgi:hypothetical protein
MWFHGGTQPCSWYAVGTWLVRGWYTVGTCKKLNAIFLQGKQHNHTVCLLIFLISNTILLTMPSMTTPTFVIPDTAKYWRSADDRSQFYGTLDCGDVPFKVKVDHLDLDPRESFISDSYPDFKPNSFIEFEVELSGYNHPFSVQIEYSDDSTLVRFWSTKQTFPLNRTMMRRLEALVCFLQELHRKIVQRVLEYDGLLYSNTMLVIRSVTDADLRTHKYTLAPIAVIGTHMRKMIGECFSNRSAGVYLPGYENAVCTFHKNGDWTLGLTGKHLTHPTHSVMVSTSGHVSRD